MSHLTFTPVVFTSITSHSGNRHIAIGHLRKRDSEKCLIQSFTQVFIGKVEENVGPIFRSQIGDRSILFIQKSGIVMMRYLTWEMLSNWNFLWLKVICLEQLSGGGTVKISNWNNDQNNFLYTGVYVRLLCIKNIHFTVLYNLIL